MNLLDETGLGRVWSNFKNWINSKFFISSPDGSVKEIIYVDSQAAFDELVANGQLIAGRDYMIQNSGIVSQNEKDGVVLFEGNLNSGTIRWLQDPNQFNYFVALTGNSTTTFGGSLISGRINNGEMFFFKGWSSATYSQLHHLALKAITPITADITNCFYREVAATAPNFLIVQSNVKKIIGFRTMQTTAYEQLATPTFPIGHIISTNTNENPSAIYGGEWELVFKRCSGNGGTDGFTMASGIGTEVNGWSLQNNVLIFNMVVTNTAAWADTAVVVGKLNLTNLGISGIPSTTRPVGHSDTNNALVMWHVGLDGTVQCVDVIARPTASTISATLPASSTPSISFTTPIPWSYFRDDVCEYFEWRRVA